LLEQEERGEVAQVTFVREREHCAEALLVDVLRAYIVVRWHNETPGRRSAMREGGADVGKGSRRSLARDGEQRLLRRPRLAIDEVHDRAGVLTDDRGVWFRCEIKHRRRVPVIAPRQPAGLVHPLLYDRPVTVARQDERM